MAEFKDVCLLRGELEGDETAGSRRRLGICHIISTWTLGNSAVRQDYHILQDSTGAVVCLYIAAAFKQRTDFTFVEGIQSSGCSEADTTQQYC